MKNFSQTNFKDWLLIEKIAPTGIGAILAIYKLILLI